MQYAIYTSQPDAAAARVALDHAIGFTADDETRHYADEITDVAGTRWALAFGDDGLAGYGTLTGAPGLVDALPDDWAPLHH